MNEQVAALRSIIGTARAALVQAQGVPRGARWSGTAGYEQQCRICTYWIFTNDPIVTVDAPEADGTTMYVHIDCAGRV